MQDKKFTFEKRLDSVRKRHGLEWNELGNALDIGKTMLHYLKTGQRDASPKVMRKLEILEACEPCELPIYAEGPTVNLPNVSEPGPQWPSENPESDPRRQREPDRFQAMESKLDAIFILLSEIRKTLPAHFRTSENPPTQYPKGEE